ncbi:MAG: hypothetical protein ABSC71_09550 [Candidatus Acidiferrales bacterium]|jgi:hypothetical protein
MRAPRRKWLPIVLALLVVAANAAHATQVAAPSAKPLGDRYLLLVNTAVASMMTDEKLTQFDKSPYDGLAVAFLHAYDTSPVPSVAEMDAKLTEWKSYTSKTIWPWVYVNRMLAIDPADKNPYSKDAYFRRFPGADLDGKGGAQDEFITNWSNALRAAKDSHAPGIVCDLEFYNYQKAYEIPELASHINQTPQAATDLLRKLGARMADAAAAQYPDAVLWFLFTGLTHPDYKSAGGQSYYPAPSYVALGMLDEIRAKRMNLKVLTGGEGSLGYCHVSMDEFQTKIRDRANAYKQLMAKYGLELELAGTLTLWSDTAAKKGWVNQYPCKESPAATVEELEPYLETLFRSYRYNWIYGSNDGGYNAFAADSAPRFDAVIRKALDRTRGVSAN